MCFERLWCDDIVAEQSLTCSVYECGVVSRCHAVTPDVARLQTCSGEEWSIQDPWSVDTNVILACAPGAKGVP